MFQTVFSTYQPGTSILYCCAGKRAETIETQVYCWQSEELTVNN